MPSPFPGMGPYLERVDLWPQIHRSFVVEISRQLNERLPAGYFAFIDPLPPWDDTSITHADNGGARIEIPVGWPPGDSRIERLQRRYPYPLVTKVLRAGDAPKVTCLVEATVGGEVAPASNLNFDAPPAELLDWPLRRNSRLIDTAVNCAEISLVWRGSEFTDREPSDWSPYCLRMRFNPDLDLPLEERDRLWDQSRFVPLAFDQPLPAFDVFVDGDTAAVSLDLQAAFETAYRASGFDRRGDIYKRPPEPLDCRADDEVATVTAPFVDGRSSERTRRGDGL